MNQHDLAYFKALTERYFKAETTEDEEAELRSFLSTNAALDPHFRDLRATFALLHERERHTRRRPAAHRFRLVAAAACLLVAVFLGWKHYQSYNQTYVRIAGEKVEADASQLMQKQMEEMFNTIEPSAQ